MVETMGILDDHSYSVDQIRTGLQPYQGMYRCHHPDRYDPQPHPHQSPRPDWLLRE